MIRNCVIGRGGDEIKVSAREKDRDRNSERGDFKACKGAWNGEWLREREGEKIS